MMKLTRNKNTQYCGMVMLFQKIAFNIHCFTHSIDDLCPNLVRVKTGKIPHTHKKFAY